MLAIENVSGGTLCQLLRERTKQKKLLTEEEVAAAIRGILKGLRHIHSIDLVHRDIKPSNIVIEDQENLESVKLVDFGLAVKIRTGIFGGIDETCGTLVY